MKPTARAWDGPTSRLVELVDPDDATAPAYTAIELQPVYRDLPSITHALTLGRSFLDRPMVFGVAPLHSVDAEAGQLRYQTGSGWSLAELLAAAQTRKRSLGPRAGAELAVLAGLVLTEAGEAGPMQGVFCHGDVSAHRILVRADGELMVLGYGLPEPEWQRMRHTGATTTTVDAMATCPPERLAGRGEDARSDLYSLAILITEVITGQRLYGGTPAEVLDAARQGQARERLQALSARKVPAFLKEPLAAMLATDPAVRPSPQAWCTTWQALLTGALPGPSLAEVAAQQEAEGGASTRLAARSRPLQGVTATRTFSLAELSARAQAPDRPEAPKAPPTAATPKRAKPRPPAEVEPGPDGEAPRRPTPPPPAPPPATRTLVPKRARDPAQDDDGDGTK